jgi:pimeloyl-ACP methyl ester carboxylesterase
LKTIECPTVFMSGRYDLVRPPADIAVIAQRVRGARHLEIEGGHIPLVQAPESLAAALIEFFGEAE